MHTTTPHTMSWSILLIAALLCVSLVWVSIQTAPQRTASGMSPADYEVGAWYLIENQGPFQLENVYCLPRKNWLELQFTDPDSHLPINVEPALHAVERY